MSFHPFNDGCFSVAVAWPMTLAVCIREFSVFSFQCSATTIKVFMFGVQTAIY